MTNKEQHELNLKLIAELQDSVNNLTNEKIKLETEIERLILSNRELEEYSSVEQAVKTLKVQFYNDARLACKEGICGEDQYFCNFTVDGVKYLFKIYFQYNESSDGVDGCYVDVCKHSCKVVND